MTTQVVNDLKELKSITQEIRRLDAELKVLRVKKKGIEENVKEYLHQVDQPGVKYGDLIVLKKESTKHAKMSKKEKEENGIQVLENIGVMNPRDVLHSILDSMKGEEMVVESLQIKETKL